MDREPSASRSPSCSHLVFSGNSKEIESSFQHSKAYLLLGGGMYLFLVFLAWLFLEEKKYTFLVEHFIHRHSVWFYAITSIFFTVIVYISLKFDPFLAFAASIGTTAFFITDGFKKNAEEKEKELLNPNMSAWSKIFYLEVLDASFSIDGVIGAFAFTMSVPLILIGNGIGAFVVREVTVRGINWISKYAYLKERGDVLDRHAGRYHDSRELRRGVPLLDRAPQHHNTARDIPLPLVEGDKARREARSGREGRGVNP